MNFFLNTYWNRWFKNAWLKDNLQHTMSVYFMLIMLASLLVGVEFILDIQDNDLKQLLLNNISQYNQQQLSFEQAFEPLVKLRNQAILMFVIIMLVMIIIFNMFINNITEPLQHMIEVSKKISEGDLTQTIHIQEKNELSELGDTINEMSANLQEISLLTRNVANQYNRLLVHVKDSEEQNDYSKEEVKHIIKQIVQLKRNFNILNSFVHIFNFSSTELK